MTKNLQKMAVAAAILGLGASAVKSAEAASVKLTFFQGADTPVAVGSFSYDESTPYEAIFPSPRPGGSPLEIKASDKWFVVQDFAVNLLGLSWNLSQPNTEVGMFSRLLWAPFDIQLITANPGSFSPSGRPTEPNVVPQWVFGDVRRLPYLRIEANSEGPGSRMNWAQAGSFQSNENYFNSGYVIAEEVKPCSENSEAVPEPGTMAGLTLAAAGLGYAKKKFKASKF